MIRAHYTATDCNIVVVGANSGIGQSLCSILNLAKAKVIGIDIQLESANIELEYFQANPTKLEELYRIQKILSECLVLK